MIGWPFFCCCFLTLYNANVCGYSDTFKHGFKLILRNQDNVDDGKPAVEFNFN